MADHLSPKQRINLRRVKAVGEAGLLGSATSATYLALERKGFIRSDPEPGRRLVVRWFATDKAAP